MFDDLMEKLRNVLKSRLMPITTIYVVLIAILIYRLFFLQIVNGQEYEKSFTNTTSRERVIQATRGNIYDVNGKLLAYNELSYNVTFLDTGEYLKSDVLNAKIAQIIDIVESSGDEIDIDDFGLAIDKKGNVSFKGSENEILRFKRDVYAVKKVSDLKEEQRNASAEEIFEYLRSSTAPNSLKFKISEEYSKKEAYKIMAVRYAMYLNNYYRYNPLVIATNVNPKTVAAVKEYSGDISGLDIASTSVRKYNEDYAYCMAHILGYTGKISEEAYKDMKKQGYSKNDQVGKTGIEQQFESTLHGTNGTETVYLDTSKRVVDVKQGKPAIPGEDVHLSIDAELQKVVYGKLEAQLSAILKAKIRSGNKTFEYVNGEKKVVIPQNAVYYAIIKNGVVNTERFAEPNATDTEKDVYNTFLSERKEIFKDLKSILSYSNPTKYKYLSQEEKDYLDFIYKMLVNKNVLKSSEFNGGEVEQYNDYLDGKLTLSEFLQYALSQDKWVDRTIFSDANQFYDSEEIYAELLKYIIDELSDDPAFGKLIYKTLIYPENGRPKISGRQICLLLFDQNVINYNKDDYAKLKSGSKSAYGFICSKIDKLELTPGQLGLDPCSGSAIITNPNDGKVMTMVSYPGYDNNKLANKIDSEYYGYLTNNDSYPLINRPIQQKTAPGSTFKMISGIAGLEEPGAGINISTQFMDDGTFHVKPYPRCGKRTGHGMIAVTRAIEVSCNVYFFNVGYKLGQIGHKGSYSDSQALEILTKYASQFGFGQPTGVELPNEAISKLSTSQGIASYIGQGTHNFTPISLAKYINSLGNRGTLYDLSIIKDSEVKVANRLEFKDSTWRAISQGNKGVLNGRESGELKDFFKDVKVTVAGKTGTAEENKNRPNHALFVSYAPFENPEIAITVVIPNGYSSHNSARLASDIYKYYFADEKDKPELAKPKPGKAADAPSSNE